MAQHLDYIHDANLYSIETHGDENRVEMRLVTEGGRPMRLTFFSVDYLMCNNFQAGNIVFDLKEIDSAKLGVGLISDLLGISEESARLELDRIEPNIRSGKKKLFSIQSSYGADILVLCRDMELQLQ